MVDFSKQCSERRLLRNSINRMFRRLAEDDQIRLHRNNQSYIVGMIVEQILADEKLCVKKKRPIST